MRRGAGAVLVVWLLVGSLYVLAQDPESLPATNLDLNVARVQQLEQLLAQREADLVGLRADVAVCQANTEQVKRDYQSLVLTNDVARTIDRLKATMGGEWIWNNDTRRIERVKAPAKEPSK